MEYGWALAILGLVVLNFPPLMGSELLMVACGVVWGKWGYPIVAVGTILGEMANFTCVPFPQLSTEWPEADNAVYGARAARRARRSSRASRSTTLASGA